MPEVAKHNPKLNKQVVPKKFVQKLSGKPSVSKQLPPKQKETHPHHVLFEKMRNTAVPQEARYAYMDQFLTLVKDKMQSYVNSPVESRMLELVCKQGTTEQRSAIMLELKPILRNLLESKYGRFTAVELLKDQFQLIREIVFPVAAKLMAGAVPNVAMNMIFINLNNKQQIMLINQIITKQCNDNEQFIIQQINENPLVIQQYIQNAQKNIQLAESKMLLGSIVCISVLLQYFKIYFYLQSKQEWEDQRTQIFNLLQFLQNIEPDQFLQLIDSYVGIELASYIFAMQPPKQKKKLIGAAKPKFAEILKDKIASQMFSTFIIQIDDTVLVKEIFIEFIVKNINFMFESTYLQHIPLLMLNQFVNATQNKKCKCMLVEELVQIVNNCQIVGQCKKDIAKRQEEICSYFVEAIVQLKELFNTNNLEKQIQTKNTVFNDFIAEILQINKVNDQNAKYYKPLEQLSIQLQNSYIDMIKANIQLLFSTISHFNFKKIIKLFNAEGKSELKQLLVNHKCPNQQDDANKKYVLQWLTDNAEKEKK